MAFVVETGQGSGDSNSYASVSDADAYFAERNVADWVGSDDEKQAWLIRATDYIDARFGSRFIGQRKTQEQALEWPRSGIDGIAEDVIPRGLQRACMEYAVRTKTSPLAPDIQMDESGMVRGVSSKSVGPLSVSYSAASSGIGSTVSLFRPYPAADMLLSGLLNTVNRVIR